jgi:hypothetical protein
MFCTVCRHLDRTNAFSFAHGGCGVFKRDRVASHANTFQPKEQGTRDLGVLFEEGLRKERERMIALIKEAYWLAYEGMQMQKFYSLNPAVVASECHRATRPTAAPRYSVRSIAIAQSRQTLNLWLACMHVPEFKAGRDWRVAQRFQDKWHEGVLNPMRYGTLRVWWSLHYEVHYEDGHTCKHPMVAADYGQGMADNWVIIQKKIR